MTSRDKKTSKTLPQTGPGKPQAFVEEPGMLAMLLDVFRGKMRFWSVFAAVLSFTAFGCALWTGWQFFHARDARLMALWGTGMGVSIFFVAMLKLWFWMEMNKHTVIHEIKRLELQVALLSKALEEKSRN